MFTNAPFKPKLTTKQQHQHSMTSNKVNTISPSSSHSTSSSSSQLIDFTVSPQTTTDSTVKEQSQISPPRRAVGSAGLASSFGALRSVNTTNDTFYSQPERTRHDGHSSSEELTTTSSSTRKRNQKKKSSLNTGHDSQQHAYANLSFNDAIVDELL